MRNGGKDVIWSSDGGVRGPAGVALGAGGPLGLLVIAVVTGVISGVTEALGVFLLKFLGFIELTLAFCRSWIDRRQS